MRDLRGREIDYMRVSITDRCNLRCAYCMPEHPEFLPEVLPYAELLRICRAAAELGIRRFRVTGGEPLAREGAAGFIADLKRVPGAERVLLTTNGTRLSAALPELLDAGLDGVNVGLNAVDPALYARITGVDCAEEVLRAVRASCESGIATKVNTVLLDANKDQIIPLALLARDLPVDVRFIELMPIGRARTLAGPGGQAALAILRERFPDLHGIDSPRGGGPAVYCASAQLRGRIGIIAANSRPFCATCNRVRLTAEGLLKPCLCYEEAVDLRGLSDEELRAALAAAIGAKPGAHCFSAPGGAAARRGMNSIGG